MLVLTRRCGENLVIADEIVVTVVAIEGNKIRLGIDAPMSVRVDRKEVHDKRIAAAEALEEVPTTVAASTGKNRIPMRAMT